LIAGWLAYLAFVAYVANHHVYEETGAIVAEDSLPAPLYPAGEQVTMFESAEGQVLGTFDRTVIFPQYRDEHWTTGVVYFWAWNGDLSGGLGDAIVTADVVNLRDRADGLEVGRINRGTEITKLYINAKNSWALCQIAAVVRSDDVRENEHESFLEELFDNSYPVITVTRLEAGDVGGQRTVKEIRDSVGFIVLAMPMLAFIYLITWTRRRKFVTKNMIRISGVTSSSINVQSPLASALVGIDERGESDVASALLRLADMIQAADIEASERQELMELVEAISEEALRSTPRPARSWPS
jgi:hypothetical protein